MVIPSTPKETCIRCLTCTELTLVFLVKLLAVTKTDMLSHRLSHTIVHSLFLSFTSLLLTSEQKQQCKHYHSRFLSILPFCPGIHIFIQRSLMATEKRSERYSVKLHHTVYPEGFLECCGWSGIELSPAGLEACQWKDPLPTLWKVR